MRSLLFVFILFLANRGEAQNWNMVYAKETEAELLLGEKQYEKAAQKFKEALKIVPQSASIMYKVGFCYLLTDDKKSEAIEYLENAVKNASSDFDPRSIKETRAPMEAHYHLGRAYQMAEKFSDAIEQYETYLQSLKPNDPFAATVEMRIASCRRASGMRQDRVTFRSTNLGEAINSSGSNFNAVFSADGNTMAYTTLGRKGYEVFISKRENETWGKPTNISKQLGANVKTSSMNAAGTQLYLVDDFDPNSEIFVSELVGKKWSKAEKLPKNINSKYSETHATISRDGKTLYFVSNRPGGVGGLDIYTTELDARGKWGKPQLLGGNVNTPFNEDTPFLSADERTLFFSSEGHNSMGGYDIFYVDLKGGNPVNMGYPINTPADNAFFFPANKPNSGYIAMHTGSSLGANDLYFVQILPQINLMGNVSVKESAPAGPIAISIENLTEGKVEKAMALGEGQLQFEHKLLPGSYRISLRAEGAETYSAAFTIPDDYSRPDYSIDLPLKRAIKPLPVAAIPETPAVLAPAPKKEEPKPVEQPKSAPAAKPVPLSEPVSARKTLEKPSEAAAPVPVTKPTPVRRATAMPTHPQETVYTVQVMALRNPTGKEKVLSIPNISIIAGNDGFHRYVVGKTNSIDEARELQQQLVDQGYSQAFVRTYPGTGKYSVQLMALRNPVGVEHFANLSNVSVERGDDGLFRYYAGLYDTVDEAKAEMARLLKLGYRDILIRSR